MQEPRRVALVTGGAKRVGRAIVRKLAAEGFDIALTYLTSRADAMQLVAEIQATGRRIIAIPADLTRPEEAGESIYREIAQNFARLDVLVNNASLYLQDSLTEFQPELMRRLMAIHVQSPIVLAGRFEKYLRTGHGHIINMVDYLGEKPWPEYLSYCASKAALWNVTISLAKSLAPEVTVNGIAPGVVEWPEGFPEEKKGQYIQKIPLKRPGTPEDVAHLVHFLTAGGSYMTGQIVRLDGGRSIV